MRNICNDSFCFVNRKKTKLFVRTQFAGGGIDCQSQFKVNQRVNPTPSRKFMLLDALLVIDIIGILFLVERVVRFKIKNRAYYINRIVGRGRRPKRQQKQ
jgi:hypothetical protein